MRKVWIVVANSSHARIYKAENVHTLIEIKTLIHSESRLTDRDLTADGPGVESDRMGFAKNTMQEQTPPKVKERNHFATEISSELDKAFHQNLIERLYLIATPPFLGYLRQAFSENVQKLIASEIPKDLVHMKPNEIREYLPPVL